MAATADHLTPEHDDRRKEYEASFRSARRHAEDPEFMAVLRKRTAELDASLRSKPMTRDEFLAQTEPG